MRAFSLPDWAFFSLIAALAAGLVALGLVIRPAGTDPALNEERLEYRGPALANFIAGPGTQVAFVPDYPGGPVARMGSTASIAARNSAGVGLVVPAEFEARVPGQRIRVEAELRRIDETLEATGLAYYTTNNGDSGVYEIPVTDQFETVGFEWTVPEGEPNGREWVGFWPDLEGRGRQILVRRVSVEILSRDE